ncbi:MAG: N-acyl-D-amino-acid deacylase family protein [Sphingobacteriales bacterium]|jgi:N-acyl-D-amino-acid deacylase
MKIFFLAALFLLALQACNRPDHYSVIIKNGIVYDGNGGEPYFADIGINGDTIAFIGDLKAAEADSIVDASGKAVAPGFINMLSWATESLIEDGSSQGDIRQGVTLEVMGEGMSMGPLTPQLKTLMEKDQGDIRFPVSWNTLGEYLQFLEKKGISCNVASFIGATTCRMYVIGEDNRKATDAELDSMKQLVRYAMREGAMGVGSSLIYPPASFSDTRELIELCKAAAEYNGMYISHMRSEGNKIHEAIDELITIAREAKLPAEIYHLKMSGKDNWGKLDSVIRQVELARATGLKITADMYTYTAGATGLTSAFPPTLQDGGFGKLWERLHDPKVRAEMKKAMNTNAKDWENLYYGCGSPDNVILLQFNQDSLKKFNGKTLAEVARIRGASPEETAMDLIIQDSTRVGVAYFLMKEENLQKQVSLPWVSFGSDAFSAAPEGVFLKSSTHPRAYGNFARVLAKYVREEKRMSLQTAIYKLSKLPATNLKLSKRGELAVGNFADIVVFDPAAIQDHASYQQPQQFATGVMDVLVNGVIVLRNGQHTGAKPGRFVKGPGFGKN